MTWSVNRGSDVKGGGEPMPPDERGHARFKEWSPQRGRGHSICTMS